MEFHVSRPSRDRYEFDLSIYNLRGNVIFANFYAARTFADRMNRKRDLARFPEQAVRPGKINAMGLIDEILHLVIQQYRQEVHPQVFTEALTWLETKIGQRELQLTLNRFSVEFPPVAVYRREQTIEEYLETRSGGIPGRESTLEEMIALWLANSNPAFSPFRELFDDSDLQTDTAYLDLFSALEEFFEQQPPLDGPGGSLLDALRSPAKHSPHSLEGQLAFLLEKWGRLVPGYIYRILTSLDLIQEEERVSFFGAGPSLVPDFRRIELEPERFSPDRDWMPAVVLIAKNVFVWLSQLSKEYSRPIERLDQIPEEELAKLQRWGITGLWLIGLWERSPASRTIKNMMGNPDAQASAYSLYAYTIAAALGGEGAYRELQQRAWEKGIRLASDMVPNHMGIDSPWVAEHPDWFLSLEHSPFPSYSFAGPDLSTDSRMGVFLEDHYFDRTDAAVVFRRLSRTDGSERYIYHGNDGTSMPWNDTAQINFLNPEAREAVIQTILGVARKFPIIRFDAAMTLAKRHYQRLWFPEPGTGGAIPSRAGMGMTKSEFDSHIPAEFWREVVDRVTQEVPDTLLLAEAFWLMEGYFVRTLGMHRVYNSAFMNMLRDEENANYRSVMKNTLQFDPDILKRFVNFMNNPDERTAVDQFGKGDKYFGICLLMATLPGLPMFGHGQVEGFTEKYGMEFRKASWDESPDLDLISRHEREIFPLLHRRRLFAEVDNFLLYDFVTASGHVDEDVFSYSNRVGTDRALIVYHNRYSETSGSVSTSVAFAQKSSSKDGKSQVRTQLYHGLGLSDDLNRFCVFRDLLSGLEYIRSNRELAARGLELTLPAYKAFAFIDFRELDDPHGQYAELERFLGGRGVPDIEEARREVLLQPIHEPMRELMNPASFRQFVERVRDGTGDSGTDDQAGLEYRLSRLFSAAAQYSGGLEDPAGLAASVAAEISHLARLLLPEADEIPGSKETKGEHVGLTLQEDQIYLALAWVLTRSLGKIVSPTDSAAISRAWMDEWMLSKLVRQSLQELGSLSWEDAGKSVLLLKTLINHQDWYGALNAIGYREHALFKAFLEDQDTALFLGVNRYQDFLWIRQEELNILLNWLLFIEKFEQGLHQGHLAGDSGFEEPEAIVEGIRETAEKDGYQVDLILSDLMERGTVLD